MKHTQPRINRGRWNRPRKGFTMLECVVAASILMVAMSTVATIAYRVHRLWMDVADQRIAMNELTNQIEFITQLPVNEVDDAIAGIAPSAIAAINLDHPELSATRTQDELGDRITVTLRWQSPHPIPPVRLVGWINSKESTP
ncbi:MAG: prepilin-type N-terminal cleavage/methylation domain-containing protein [Rhodopirellula sp. JB053]|uniref:prepilin-type N-terminal cleavage/methylation domain-containing protein n=1 Tax=Rhodopirellula sp. JB044 TaxID=3342844 RepID=UPI00370B8E87